MKKFILLTIAFVVAFSCTSDEDYETLNKNPNSPAEVSDSQLFVSAINSLTDFIESTNVNVNNFRLYAQYWTQTQYTDESNYEEWEEKLVDFDKGSSCEPVESNRLMAASETFSTGVTGTMKALLASVSGSTYNGTTQANCGDSTRIFGVFSPTNDVVISEQTQGLEVSFTITDRGVSVFGGNNPYDVEFGSGPFTPKFQTF